MNCIARATIESSTANTSVEAARRVRWARPRSAPAAAVRRPSADRATRPRGSRSGQSQIDARQRRFRLVEVTFVAGADDRHINGSCRPRRIGDKSIKQRRPDFACHRRRSETSRCRSNWKAVRSDGSNRRAFGPNRCLRRDGSSRRRPSRAWRQSPRAAPSRRGSACVPDRRIVVDRGPSRCSAAMRPADRASAMMRGSLFSGRNQNHTFTTGAFARAVGG